MAGANATAAAPRTATGAVRDAGASAADGKRDELVGSGDVPRTVGQRRERGALERCSCSVRSASRAVQAIIDPIAIGSVRARLRAWARFAAPDGIASGGSEVDEAASAGGLRARRAALRRW
jgi:hypothetical protein